MPTTTRCGADVAAVALSLAATALLDRQIAHPPPPAACGGANEPEPSVFPPHAGAARALPTPERTPEPLPAPMPKSLSFSPSIAYLADGMAGDGVFRRQSVPTRLELVAAGDTIYMLDQSGQLLWSQSFEGNALTDMPIVDSSGTVIVTAYDLIWVGLDAVTGTERWRRGANGRALYAQLERYGPDRYFVVVDRSGYREGSSAEYDSSDYVVLCEGPRVVWSTKLPAGALVAIDGSRVSLVFEKKGRRIVRALSVPARFRPRGAA